MTFFQPGVFGGRADPTGAQALAAGEADALALDFVTDTAWILDSGTPANDYSGKPGASAAGAGKLVYTSPSLKAVMQADGEIKYSAHNLISYSEAMNSWGGVETSATADTITDTTGNDRHIRFLTKGSNVGGAVYAVSAELKAGTLNYGGVQISTGSEAYMVLLDLSDGSVADTEDFNTPYQEGYTVETVGDGWYRLTVYMELTSSTTCYPTICLSDSASPSAYVFGAPSYTGTGSGTIQARKAILRRLPSVDTYLPVAATTSVYALPIEFDTSGNSRGLLVEEARTNVAVTTESFGAAWTKTHTTISADATTAPSGETTADKIVEDSGANQHLIYDTLTCSNTTQYCWSIFVKAAERSYAAATLAFGGGDRYGVCFDLSDGSFVDDDDDGSSPAGTGYGSESVGDGWYRIWVTCTSDSTTAYPHVGIQDDASVTWTSATPTYTGDGSSGIYAWGAQLEAGAFPTSYISNPSSSASVTRAADDLSLATSGIPYNDGGPGSMYIKFTPIDASAPFHVANMYLDSDDRIAFYSDNGAVPLKAYMEDGNVTQINATAGNLADATEAQVAYAWSTNDAGVSLDGASAVLDGSCTMTSGLTSLRIGADENTGQQLNGHIAQLVYVPRRKTDAELEAETA